MQFVRRAEKKIKKCPLLLGFQIASKPSVSLSLSAFLSFFSYLDDCGAFCLAVRVRDRCWGPPENAVGAPQRLEKNLRFFPLSPALLPFSLSVFLYVCLTACLFVCLSLLAGLSVCLYFCQSVCLFVCLSVCLSICPSVRPTVFLSVCLHKSFFFSLHSLFQFLSIKATLALWGPSKPLLGPTSPFLTL